MIATLALSVLAAVSSVHAVVSNVTSSACPTNGGTHIIVARASLEQVGYGTIGAVKDSVLSMVPGSTAEYVEYPATLNDYFNSETAGVVAMRQLVETYLVKCPCSPLVLMGYSQGAQVTADTLVGQEVAAFPDNTTVYNGEAVDQPLPNSDLSRVAAAVIMGDPTFNTTESFHVGNATKNALFPREDVSNFEATGLSSRIKSYCDALDPYCASGSFDNISVHTGYVKEYGVEAAEFVVAQLKKYQGCSSTSSNSTGVANGTTSSPTPTGSSPAYTGAASHVYGATGAGLVAVLGAMFALL